MKRFGGRIELGPFEHTTLLTRLLPFSKIPTLGIGDPLTGSAAPANSTGQNETQSIIIDEGDIATSNIPKSSKC
jgi:hypothetical protein